MFRILKIASNRWPSNVRPLVDFTHNHLTARPSYHNGTVLRNYSKKPPSDKQDCKPKDIEECKEPPEVDCEKKVMPALQECAKPNLMSECPAPECPYDETCKKKEEKSCMIWALLAAAATLAALYFFLNSGKKEPTKPGIKPARKSKKLVRPQQKKVPENSKDIPKEVQYLLIGGGTASFSAFRAIKSNDPMAKVLVVSNEDHFPYMRPPLSKELWFSDDADTVKKLEFKQWNGAQRSLFYEPKDFYKNAKDLPFSEKGGVAIARGWSITHLDVINRRAFLDDGCEIAYDKCLIATGSMPKNLDVIENASKEVLDRCTVFRTIYDFQCLQERLKEAKSVTVIGGGFLGSELACALGRRTKDNEEFKVYQVFKENGNMGHVLPEYLSFWTSEKVKSQGVEVIPNAEVIAATPTSEGVSLSLSNGKSVKSDLVVVCVGATPNTEMAKQSYLETDHKDGGFLVNTELQARSHLYVAGDAACYYDPSLGRRRIEHHDNAVISGRLAGENMTGSSKPYKHQSMFWSDLGPDVGFEAIGLVCSSLPTVGVFVKHKADQTVSDPGKVEEAVPDQCVRYMGKEAEEKAEAKKKQVQDEAKKKTEDAKKKAAARPGEDFSKGVVFYLKDDKVVGVVLWNVFNRMSVARQVIKDQRKYDDLNEVAKLFNIHEE